MALMELNRLVESLRSLASEHLLEEKWLIAPSRRIGYQWLDSLTRYGSTVLNFRVKTMRGMALELAAPLMSLSDSSFLGDIRKEVVMSRILAGLLQGADGYLSALKPGPGLTRMMLRTVDDLRLAGLSERDLRIGDFEVGSKGRDIKKILSAYCREIKGSQMLDYADVIRVATERLRNDASALPDDGMVLIPEDTIKELGDLELSLWRAIPEARRIELPVDIPGEATGTEMTDSQILRWILDPTAAPSPRDDGTACIFRAVGEVNEIREIIRRCFEGRIHFDDVEILHTDSGTYIPLIYEIASLLGTEHGNEVPVTFAEGIPVRYSRPARALTGFLSWIQEDYPQSTLVRMVQDGLLLLDDLEDAGLTFTQIGAILRAVPVGFGRDRYLASIDREIISLNKRVRESEPEDDETGMVPADNRQYLERWRAGLEILRSLIQDLQAYARSMESGQIAFLRAAAAFIEKRCRDVNRFDEYAGGLLLEEIGELIECLDTGDVPGLDVHGWLEELAGSSRVGGQGPRPGCLFVASIHGGGHSGREHTFIVGLDDNRFPGTGRQDPLILDDERRTIDGDLPTGSGRLARNVHEFAALLARLGGSITLSYSSRSLVDDRDKFPSPAILSAYRILSGNHQGDQGTMIEWMDDAASFAPMTPERCIDLTEWWLCRTCGEQVPDAAGEAIAGSFPHLGRGLVAAEARESAIFTEYDGYVPEAGSEQDPTHTSGQVLSAARLETLGRCPMEYFFRYVLEIETPPEYTVDPARWLDPAQRGAMLHAVFREFMSVLHGKSLLPDLGRDWKLMRDILDQEIASWRKEIPPPSEEIFDRECEDLARTARIFLQEEQLNCRTSRPAFFEASIGLPSVGDGCVLDTPVPVEIGLPGGSVIRARGRVDRIDRLPDAKRPIYYVWDYKTGSSSRYKRDDPFRGGRCVQSSLYLAMVNSRLDELEPTAKATKFGYFFPSTREHGERMEWTSEQLSDGGHVISGLCEMIANGCFPFTDDTADVRFSDYRAAFGDLDVTANGVSRKLEESANEVLQPLRRLRGYE